MQKSKKYTIILIIAITLFFLFCQNFLIKFGLWYTYLICPIVFVGVAAIINELISTQIVIRNNRKDIIQYVVITNLLYILIYLVSGIYPGFGKNPYDTSIKGIIINILSNVPVIVALELMRYKLANNVYKRDKNLIFFLVVISFSIWDLNLRRFFWGNVVPYTVFSFLFYYLIPVIVKNVLFTYVAQNGDYWPNIIYRLLEKIFIWTLPILPNLPEVFEAILSTVLPLFLLLYIRYHINLQDRNYAYLVKYENPGGLIPFTMLLVVLIWFTLGAFPIKPIGVATGSMKPEISVGDVVVMREINPENLKVGDIIGYKLNETTIVHRIVNISRNTDLSLVITTKGDNNRFEDTDPVRAEQVVGKVMFKVKYLALPTIWLHSLYVGREDVGVETGDLNNY